MLCGCTAVLGVALVVLGRLRLASLVQYLPMPVVGGYLAYIGYFCGQAGLAFASGVRAHPSPGVRFVRLAHVQSVLFLHTSARCRYTDGVVDLRPDRHKWVCKCVHHSPPNRDRWE